MAPTPTGTALGIGALFVGGLIGGLLGSAFFSPPAAPATIAQQTGSGSQDDGLRAAIEALTAELRRANVPTPADGDLRAPATGAGSSPTAAQDFGAVIAALERLTQALGQARGGVAGGGIGISPLVLPPPGNRSDVLSQWIGRPWEELSSEYRFLTYQQVLDRFGRPDEVSADSWFYRLGSGETGHTFTFKFSDGYLMNVYP